MRGFVVPHVFGDGADDSLVGQALVSAGGSGRFHDVGLGDFAGALVQNGNDGAVGYIWVGEEMGLQFGGSDLMALLIMVRILH